MKKNANNKLKLDKKTVSKLNSIDAVNVNGGRIYFPFPIKTIVESCFCMITEGCGPAPDVTDVILL
jgi:hypothetical protein